MTRTDIGGGVLVTATDQAEFDKLRMKTQRQAFKVAYRLTGNRDDAEDLTQEAYMRAYRSFGTYNRSLPFEGWFYRILSNLFIDLLRRRPKQKPLSLDACTTDDGDSGFVLQIADTEGTPEELIVGSVMDERVAAAVAQLPPMFRRAVTLCDLHNATYEEIAVAMNCSIGTVRSRIHRGRALVRRYLERHDAVRSATGKLPRLYPTPI